MSAVMGAAGQHEEAGEGNLEAPFPLIQKEAKNGEREAHPQRERAIQDKGTCITKEKGALVLERAYLLRSLWRTCCDPFARTYPASLMAKSSVARGATSMKVCHVSMTKVKCTVILTI